MIREQEIITSKFNSYTLDTLPRTVLLVGDKGSGRHSIINELANRLDLLVTDITDNINLDTVQNIELSVKPQIYVINADNISVKNQNTILKLLEEPLKNTYLFLVCSNIGYLLDTITNRCRVFTMLPYKKEFLNSIKHLNNSWFLKVINTPGVLLETDENKLESMKTLCDSIIRRIGKANTSNTLSISKKLNYKDESDKFDVDVFCKMLYHCYRDEIVKANDEQYFKAFIRTSKLLKDLRIPNISKQNLVETFLLDLKEIYETTNI